MSRHILAHATKPKGFFVVGYDRPVGAFYCQAWTSPKSELSWTNDCFDIDDLPRVGATVPPELRGILVQEAAGKIDPNYVRDWRAAS